MSKKDKKHNSASPVDSATHATEYRIIKYDLIRVLVLNAIYLAAVLGIYFTDQKAHYLQPFFGKILHF